MYFILVFIHAYITCNVLYDIYTCDVNNNNNNNNDNSNEYAEQSCYFEDKECKIMRTALKCGK